MGHLFFTAGLTIALAAVCAWIAVVDFRAMRIPDLASLPLIAAGLLLSGVASHMALADRLIGAGVGFLALWAIGEAYFRWRGVEALGIGDAKLYAAAGAWLGWAALPAVLLIAAVMGLVFAALRPSQHPSKTQSGLAFGPWLAAAFLVCWLHLIF